MFRDCQGIHQRVYGVQVITLEAGLHEINLIPESCRGCQHPTSDDRSWDGNYCLDVPDVERCQLMPAQAGLNLGHGHRGKKNASPFFTKTRIFSLLYVHDCSVL